MPVDLVILCGFLGSGKTTLLVDYLKEADSADTGIIVNEVGEIGVDGAIVANESGNLPMTLLANGCVCCSLRSDLVFTINALLDAPRPEGLPPLRRIILETSGVSRPGPIIASLADPDLVARQLRLTVLTTYDCTSGLSAANVSTSDASTPDVSALKVSTSEASTPDARAATSFTDMFEEAAAQLAAANRIVLTKTDQVSAVQLRASADHARALNPLAEVVDAADRSVAVRAAFAPDQNAMSGSDAALKAVRSAGALANAHPRMRVLIAQPKADLDWTDFSEWLDDLAGLCGDRLLRVKAVVRVVDCPDPILIQSVGTTFSAPRRLTRRPDATPVVIVIVRDMLRADIEASMPSALMTFLDR